MHRQILGQLLVAADDVDHDADLGTAVHVGSQLALGFDTHKAADRHVLADLADQRGTGGFHRAFAHRQRRKRSDISRIPGCDQFGATLGEGDEFVVLGDEVGFAIDFDHRAELAVG